MKLSLILLITTTIPITKCGDNTCDTVCAGNTSCLSQCKAEADNPKRHPLSTPHCGLTYVGSLNDDPMRQKVPGVDVLQNPDTHPWAVTFHANYEDIHFCGGVIISERLVLTAAHCLHNKKLVDFHMMSGTSELTPTHVDAVILKPDNLSFPGLVYKRWVKLHDKYSDETLDNDIALIRTSDPIPFRIKDDHFIINSVCLPPADYQPSGMAILAGWGHPQVAAPVGQDEAKTNSQRLQVFKSPVITNAECQTIAQETRYYKDSDGGYEVHKLSISDTKFCVMSSMAPGVAANDSYKGPEGGDSGSPYIQHIDNKAHLVGLTSYSDPWIQNPTVLLTQVSKFLDWIDSMAKLDLDSF